MDSPQTFQLLEYPHDYGNPPDVNVTSRGNSGRRSIILKKLSSHGIYVGEFILIPATAQLMWNHVPCGNHTWRAEKNCLVVWNIFFSIYWESSSRLTFIFFQRGRYTTNQKTIDDFPRCNVSDVGIFGRAIFDDTRPLVICYIANWKITMLWENPLFLWPFSIAFCMFTRG